MILPLIAFLLGLISLFIDPKELQGNQKWGTLIVISTLLFFICWFSISENNTQSKKEKQLQSEIKRLQEENRQLLKISSLGKGYHIIVRGVVSFGCSTLDGEVRKGLDNLFLKFVELNIGIKTSNGNIYRGAVNQIANPQVTTFFGVEKLENYVPSNYSRYYLRFRKDNSYYFEIQTSDIRISHENIQYSVRGVKDKISASLAKYNHKEPLLNFYKIAEVYVKEAEIIELNQVVNVDRAVTFKAESCTS